jgi:hypothetical protein
MSKDDSKDVAVIEPPPRNTAKARLPDECILQRSCFNRSKIFTPNAEEYREMRSMASITQHVDRVSRFHSLGTLNNRTAADFRATTLCCWHDSSPFDGPVVALPKSFDAQTQCFVVYGCFCSIACAAAHLLEQTGYETTSQLLLLDRMAREVYGVTEYIPAPPRLSLEMYGGPYSLERFRGMSSGGEALMVAPPFVSTYMVVEERDVGAHHISTLGLNGIGTVRGLRRPAQPICMTTTDVPENSPYLDFLAQKGLAGRQQCSAACTDCTADVAEAAGERTGHDEAHDDGTPSEQSTAAPPIATTSATTAPAIARRPHRSLQPQRTAVAKATAAASSSSAKNGSSTLARFMQ